MRISNKTKIRKILSLPASIPDEFIPKELIPIDLARYISLDTLPGAWSSNGQFNLAEVYPVYEHEGVELVIGKDGVGRKMTPSSWKMSSQESIEEIALFLDRLSRKKGLIIDEQVAKDAMMAREVLENNFNFKVNELQHEG